MCFTQRHKQIVVEGRGKVLVGVEIRVVGMGLPVDKHSHSAVRIQCVHWIYINNSGIQSISIPWICMYYKFSLLVIVQPEGIIITVKSH